MDVGGNIAQIASDVGGAAKDAAVGVAKGVGAGLKQAASAVSPLDILEQLLGQGPSQSQPGEKKDQHQQDLEKAMANTDDPAKKAQIQQQLMLDKQQQQQKLQAHRQNMAKEEQWYEQKMAQQNQQKQMEEKQKEEEKKYEIEQLKRQKSENLQVQMAKDQANAEKRMGAG